MAERKPRKSVNIAFCGIMCALSVISMFAALVPSLTYAVPAVAGLMLWVISVHISRKWALLSFIAVSLMCFMLIPEIEARSYFVAFFGYYPIIRSLFEKIKNKLLRMGAKLLLFNVAVVVTFNILCFVIGADKMLSGLEDFGTLAVYVFWGAANVAFVIYDLCLDNIMYAYSRWIQPRFKKIISKN